MATQLLKLMLMSITLSLLAACSSAPTKSNRIDYEIPTKPLEDKEARKVILHEAIAQLGKPYKLGGNSPNEGFDCSGLVFYSYLKAGKLVERRAEDQFLAVKQVKQVKPGDLVFFTTDSRGKHIDHVGIYIGKNKFIHAPGKGKSIVSSDITDDYWQKRFKGAGNFFE